MEPGGYVWQNFLGGFVLEAKYEVWEMNLSGFTVPANPLCDGCSGRWALDPSLDSLADANYDVDNDSLMNSAEAPDRWNTNPVDDDTIKTCCPTAGRCSTVNSRLSAVLSTTCQSLLQALVA